MHNSCRLEVWHESVELAAGIYRLTEEFPAQERYGLTSQMRSAAVSVGSNIAARAGRASPGELARFRRIAMGSISELDSQLEVAVRLGFVERHPDPSEPIRRLSRRLLRFHERVSHDRLKSTYQIPNT